MRYTNIDSCTRRDVPTFATLFFLLRTEQAGVVSFLHYNKRHSGFVISFKFNAGFTNSGQLVLQNMQELAFGDTITVKNYSVRFIPPSAFVKPNKKFRHH